MKWVRGVMHAAPGVKDLGGYLVITRWQSPDRSITRSERLKGGSRRMSGRENVVSCRHCLICLRFAVGGSLGPFPWSLLTRTSARDTWLGATGVP